MTALVALAAAWLLYGAMTDPERIRRRCEQYLRRFVDGEVTVESATFSVFGGTLLNGVRVTEAGAAVPMATPDRPFFYCENLLLKHDPAAMLLGKLSVGEVVATDPVCSLVRTDETGAYNIGRIFRRSAPERSARKPRLPVVRLRNASLMIAREHRGVRRDVDQVNLSVVATPISETVRSYSVVWKRTGADQARGRSMFDLRTLAFKDLDGGLPWLSLETGMLVAATQVPEVDRWFSLLGLSGRIKAEGYNVSFRGARGGRGRLSLRLRDGALSVPVDEVERRLPREQRYLRFDSVEGVVELSPARADVQFTGVFHGAPCRVSATLAGKIGPHAHLDDVSLSAVIACDDLTLPSVGENAVPAVNRFVERWRPLRSFYRDFDPHGRVALEGSVAKAAGAGQPVRLTRGVMTVLHADGSYRKFPYRVRNVTGSVEFTPEGIYLRELAGEHDGAPVVVNGWLAEARWYGAAELHLSGRGASLDADLHDALNRRYQKLWDAFELAGAADISVSMTRAPGTVENPQPYVTIVNAELKRAQARFAGFPYAVEDVSGGVAVSGDRLSVTRLAGSNGAARVIVDGYADLASEGLSDLKLHLAAEGVAFDDELFAALPEDARTRVTQFAPRGMFDLAGGITFDPAAGRVKYDLAATLHGVQMTYRIGTAPTAQVTGVSIDPAGFSYPLTIVDGTVKIGLGRVAICDLHATHDDTQVTLDGAVTFDNETVEGAFALTGKQIALDEDLRLAVPWRWRRAWNKLSPVGTVDLELDGLRYRRQRGAAADWDFEGQLTLHGTALDVGARITDVRGSLRGSGSVGGTPPELNASAAIALDSVTINRRRVEQVRGRLEKCGTGDALTLLDLSGKLYGGLIASDVRVSFERSAAHYDVSATMQDVDLRKFLSAGNSAGSGTGPVAGRMDAHIFMNGASGRPDSRRGGGKVSVRDAELYKLPLIAAILNVINFTVPQESAFQEMSAEFFVTGRRVEVRDIVLRGAALALVGSGVIVPDGGPLALKLVAVTPHRWIKVPVITEFLEGAARELVEVDVSGTLDAPVVQARPLRGVEAAFATLFETRKPTKSKLLAPRDDEVRGDESEHRRNLRPRPSSPEGARR